jgi:hypothetical protein
VRDIDLPVDLVVIGSVLVVHIPKKSFLRGSGFIIALLGEGIID